MATAEAIAIRQQLAAERIARATGLQLPFVKGGAPIKLAAYLEVIADAAERGDITLDNRSTDHVRTNQPADGSSDDAERRRDGAAGADERSSEPRGDAEEPARAQRRGKGKGGR